jgi:hypothetical protein
VSLGVGIGVSLAVAPQLAEQRSWVAQSLRDVCTQKRRADSYFWGPLASLSLPTDIARKEKTETIVEPNTGVSFPSVLDETKQLAGVGVRKTSIVGPKSIRVYAFGLYVDENSLKENFVDKYGKMSVTELKDSKEFYEDVIGNDLNLTLRLEIVYGKLSIGSVRSAFEVLIGSRLRRFNGSQNKELLQRFTSQFKDEYKLSRGTKIHFTRLPGHVLQTKIGEQEVGLIQSPLLCRSLFDLYIGDYPFDKQAKEKIGVGLASLLTQ